MSNISSFLLLGTVVTLLSAASAQGQMRPEARILSVQPTVTVAVVESTFKNTEPLRLPTYVRTGRRVSQAALEVNWQAVGALPAGALVRFSYRQPGREEARHLDHRYDHPVTGLQRVRFAVSQEDPARDRVTAWRLQVRHGDNVLAEQRSAAWK